MKLERAGQGGHSLWLALLGLRDLDRLIGARLRLIGRYRSRLAKLAGCQSGVSDDRTSVATIHHTD
jgi:hypothetical protein